MTTIFLHGFWGAPADWAEVLKRLPLSAGTWCPDLYRDEGLGPEVEPLAWADRFVHRVRARLGSEPAQLVGYSMGGRLALHAILRVPGVFRRSLMVSARPLPPADADARAAWETAWAKRFRADPWADLTRDWSAEPVFAGSRASARRCDDDLRPGLADSLDRWSVRRHAFGAAELRGTTARVDWAFGASDQKYLGVANQLREIGVGGQISIIPHAGHRVPFDAPDVIARWVSTTD